MTAPVIHTPAPGAPLGVAAAAAAARSRLSVRRLFPRDARYGQAFGVIAPGQTLAAVEGGALCGVLMVRRNGRDGFDLSPALFARLYGPVPGRARLLAYRAMEAATSGPATHIAAFWVAPDARGKGVGAALLSALTAAAGAEITLLSRPGREDFYARHGFAPGGSAWLRLVGRIAGMTPMRRPAPQTPARS